MTTDPFQLFIIVLIMGVFPFALWASGRIGELIVDGEEDRVPENLKKLAKKEYVEAVRKGKREKDDKWKFFVAVIGLVMPTIMLCFASAGNFIPRFMVVLTSSIVFFVGVALLEWFVRPRS